MPITTTILKNTKQQTIIKIVGDGSTNIDLPNLAISSDTIDVQANLNVPITNLRFRGFPDIIKIHHNLLLLPFRLV